MRLLTTRVAAFFKKRKVNKMGTRGPRVCRYYLYESIYGEDVLVRRSLDTLPIEVGFLIIMSVQQSDRYLN